MAKRTVVDCDSCPKEDLKEGEFAPFDVVFDRVADAAGGMEDVTERVELCVGCLAKEVQAWLNTLPFADREAWLNKIKPVTGRR